MRNFSLNVYVSIRQEYVDDEDDDEDDDKEKVRIVLSLCCLLTSALKGMNSSFTSHVSRGFVVPGYW